MNALRVALIGLAALVVASGAAAQAKLERVIIVQRHGVRPPTKAAADLAKFSEQAWPEWPVAPGELTKHGANAIAIMGAAIKRTYVRQGLIAGSGCPAGVFVWSDSADQRTQASGDALMQGFGCTTPSQHLAAGATDPVFDPIEAGLCPIDPSKAKAAIESRLPGLLERNRRDYDKARQTMQAILTPSGCGKTGQRECLIGDGDDMAVAKDGDVRLSGPLANASGLTENLLLEYSEGMALADVGWGRAGTKLDEVLTLHNLYADVMRRAPYFAARRGSLLAQQVADLMAGHTSRFQGAAVVPGDRKLVVFLGHDTNLSNFSGLLDAAWSLPGQPDHTAPDTAIAFERWRNKNGTAVVKVRVFYQTLEDLRGLAAIVEPRSVDLTVCAHGRCTLAAFTAKLAKAVAPECLKP